jgi:hypothetical protein
MDDRSLRRFGYLNLEADLPASHMLEDNTLDYRVDILVVEDLEDLDLEAEEHKPPGGEQKGAHRDDSAVIRTKAVDPRDAWTPFLIVGRIILLVLCARFYITSFPFLSKPLPLTTKKPRDDSRVPGPPANL